MKGNITFMSKISSLLLLGVILGLGAFLFIKNFFVISENLEDGDNYDINEDPTPEIDTPEKKAAANQEPSWSADYPN
jgi:hypothetical protein